MKIAQILYPGLGGHTTVAFSLIEGDIDRNYQHVLIGYGIEMPGETFKEKAREKNTTFYTVLKRKGLDLLSYITLWKYLRQEKPDVILMHSTGVVFTVFLYNILYRVKWIAVEHQSNFAKSKIDWLYTFFIMLLAPKIVYLNKEYKEQVQDKIGLFFRTNKITIIPNGINVEKYRYAHNKIKVSDNVHIAMIGRFTPLRDHETLIRAIAEIKSTLSVRLFLAGDGNTKTRMERLVRELNLRSEVIFLGDISETVIIDLLQKIDIYIHSSFAETQSTSILQVMASKTPIIATNIPGINNILEHKFNGVLFKTGNVNQLSKCIIEMINADNDQIVGQAYKLVEREFNLINMFENYSKLWKK